MSRLQWLSPTEAAHATCDTAAVTWSRMDFNARVYTDTLVRALHAYDDDDSPVLTAIHFFASVTAVRNNATSELA